MQTTETTGNHVPSASGVKVGSLVGGYEIKKLLYLSGTGGAVYSAYEAPEREEKDNFAACRVLADVLGWVCLLIPPDPNRKTADMIKADDLSLWEIKTSYSGSAKTINKALQRASHQSKNAIVRIAAEDFDIEAIEKAARQRKRFSGLKQIMFIAKGGITFLGDEH